MKVKPKKHQKKATAYMLVYINRNDYRKIFKETENMFPQWLIDKTK